MKTKGKLGRIYGALGIGVATIGSLIVVAASALPQKKAPDQTMARTRIVPMQFERPIPLKVQSPGVEWRGQTYHLVSLGSIQFELDQKTGHLQAAARAGITTFDKVDYDISAAVLDAAGELLGTARAQCNVERNWLGQVLNLGQTISLDFGVSLDYAKAASFMVSVSKRPVLTPDDWQK
ncbi:MAG TPA: hypothetical protein VMF06_23895 [Candidatus Limnocylindria bacterium]|jgi:hypothetical protein|nr:hypothetical protein [Candidatus Limnocylindria bacterium]